jgi:uncharacterized protein
MAELKDRLRSDLTTAMKARDQLTTSTLRMALTAVTNSETSGRVARELTDAEVLQVLVKEAKKRREAADAFTSAGRQEMAEKELAEGSVLDRYLPAQLTGAEIADIVRDGIAEVGATGMRQMGAVMKTVQPKVQGRADGKAVSEEVRRQLGAA